MNIHIINNETIHTYYCHDRAFWGCCPWVATYDDYDPTPIDYETSHGCPSGEGSTEQEAIDDLLDR